VAQLAIEIVADSKAELITKSARAALAARAEPQGREFRNPCLRAKMEVPNQSLTISKSQGAARQVEEAVQALERGDFDIAVTLAGAAEGMMGDRSGMREYMLTHPGAADYFQNEKELGDALNEQVNWLKHSTPDRATAIFTRSDAVRMIMRAMTKLDAWTPRMQQFRDWWEANVDDL
jgi:hypothetical protein